MSEASSLTVSLPLDLPTKVVTGLRSVAQQTGRDVSDLAEEAMAACLAVQQRHFEAIGQAVAEADAGAKRYSNDEVMAWLESWETPNELPPPS